MDLFNVSNVASLLPLLRRPQEGNKPAPPNEAEY